jgi:hypothetical protein
LALLAACLTVAAAPLPFRFACELVRAAVGREELLVLALRLWAALLRFAALLLLAALVRFAAFVFLPFVLAARDVRDVLRAVAVFFGLRDVPPDVLFAGARCCAAAPLLRAGDLLLVAMWGSPLT